MAPGWKHFVQTFKRRRGMSDAYVAIGGPSSINQSADEHAVPESKSWRYWVVLWFTLGFCIAELAVAIITHSLALLSEAFHNFGDVFTLLIALYVDKHQSRSSDPSFSYGFRRAEVVGALVNGVSLLSLCVFVILQAIPRFFETVDVQSGMLFIVTASVGLLVNVLGVFCFAGHGHSHGLPGSGDACAHGHAHQHSHNEHTAAQSHGSPHAATRSLLSNEGGSLIRLRELSDAPPPCAHDHDHDHGHGHDHDHGHGHDHHGHSHDERHEHTEHEDMNMRAVFLHFIADSLSSICVLTVGLTLHFFHDAWWVVYVDPSSSLVIVAITLYLTYPLVRQCIAIVMQATPDQIDLVLLARELRNISPRVAHIHALHCWSQNGGSHIGTAHVRVQATDKDAAEAASWMPELMSQLRSVFHRHNVHETSIQTELTVGSGPVAGCVEQCTPGCQAALETIPRVNTIPVLN